MLSQLLGYDDIRALLQLSAGDYGYDSCYDYIDSLHQRDDEPRFGITIFVEPCGDITKWGESFSKVAEWWQAVFSSQPKKWDYVKSGWWLMDQESNLPDDPLACWKRVNH